MKHPITRLLAVILSVQLLVAVLPLTAAAAETGGVKLSGQDASGILPFQVANLFPGDMVSKTYTVTTVHDNPTTLYFQVDVASNSSQALARNLSLTVTVDGQSHHYPSVQDCVALPLPMAADRKTATYQLDFHLPTSAGNDCMEQALYADFRWWYLDGETNGAVSLKPTAEVLLDTSYPSGSQFQFQLTDHLGNTHTVKNQDGAISFPSLSFDTPGTYRYTITQIPGSDSGITYDTAKYEAVVTVTGTPGADLQYTLVYTRDGQPWNHGIPRFVNVTKGQSVPDDPSEVTPDNPKMGDSFPLKLYTAIAITTGCALVCLLLLWRGRRKEDDRG